jgi:quercetin dioxygenase-like cupin family protein
MRTRNSVRQSTIQIAAFLVVLSVVPLFAQNLETKARKDRARVLLSTPIPALDGAHVKTTLVEVNYGPGEASPPHTHPCAVIGYVVEGSLRMRVEGQPEKLYSVGESFYEAPNGVHAVSANASTTQPAKLIAYFVCDHDAPLSANVPASHAGGN